MSGVQVLDQGWHEDMPMEEYLSLPLVSSSALTIIQQRPPAYLKWALHNKDSGETTAAKSMGSLAHTAILEPDLLEATYIVEPDPDPEVFTTSTGKPSSNPRATGAWKEIIAGLEASGKTVVTADEWASALEMRDALWRNKRARQLLQATGPVEISGIVVEPETGVPCKIRPDKLVPAIGANVNLKTTDNAHPTAFSRSVYSFRYDRSMAFYKIMLDALGFEHRRPIIIAAETNGPKLVAVRELDEGTMYAGEEQARALLRKIARCFDRDEWPGYPDEVESQALPHWAWAKRDEELQEIEHGY